MNQEAKSGGSYKNIDIEDEENVAINQSSKKQASDMESYLQEKYGSRIDGEAKQGCLGKFWQTKGWLICSVIASCCFGVASFFLGDVSRKGIVAKNLLSLGFMIVAVVYMIATFIKNYFDGIRIWSFTDNDWVYESEFGITVYDWKRLVGMILSSLGNVMGTYFVALSFQLSIDAGVNQGVISSLFVLSAVFCAVFAYIFLKEAMGPVDYVGMVMMIGCAILLSFSQSPENEIQVAVEDRISAIYPVLAAIGSSLGFGIRSVLIKYWVEKDYNVYNFAMQSLFVDGLIGTVYLIIQATTMTGVVTSDIIVPGILSGLIAGVGTVLINYSISVGIAGPASAMANLAAVVQTILDYFLLGQVLNSLQIIGLVVGLGGAMVLAVGLSLFKVVAKLFGKNGE